jgi:hypothetical protein
MLAEHLLFISTGSALAGAVLFDVFLTIVVPRATSRKFRIAPLLYMNVLWPLFRALTANNPSSERRNDVRGLFAPAAFFCVFIVWLALLQFAFGLILLGFGNHINPHITSFTDAWYFAGISILTIGFGDVVPVSTGARIAVLVAAVCGLLFMALLVSHLFSLQSQLHNRERVVNEMASRAGSPASGIVLLMRYRELEIMDKLNDDFTSWERWLAEVLESHRAFPELLYYPSSSTKDSWLSVTGALLDAATLLTCAVRDESRGRAELFYSLGCTAVQALCGHIGMSKYDGFDVTRQEFDLALELLSLAGYELADADLAWRTFRLKREGYAGYLGALCSRFDSPTQAWIKELNIAHLPRPAGALTAAAKERSELKGDQTIHLGKIQA